MVNEETRIVGNLPHLRMEIIHRQDTDGGAEHITLHLSALPSFQAAGRMMPGAPGGFAAALPGLDPASAAWANPWAAWADLAQAMMAPWMQGWAAALPWLSPPGSARFR